MSEDGNRQSRATSTSFPVIDHTHNTADKTITAVPQKPLVSEQFLPQVKAAAFRNCLTWRGGEQGSTGGLAPQHPLIQDWKRKRRTSSLPKSPSPLIQHHFLLSDSSAPTTSNASLNSRNKSYKHPHSGSSGSRNIKFHTNKSEHLRTAMKDLHCCQDREFCRNGRHCHRSKENENLKKTCSYADQISHDKSTVTVLPDIGLTTSESTLNNRSLRGQEDPFRKLKNESQMIQGPPLAAHTQNTRHFSTHDQSSNKPDQSQSDTQVHPFCSTTSSGESIRVGSMSGAELLIASTTSLAHLTSSRSELSSVPSLPTIQSTIQTGHCTSNSKMDGKGTGHERRSSSRCQRVQQGRDHPCTVVNLRIPFGKVEEWYVPQAKRQNCKKSAVSVDGARPRAAVGHGDTAEDGESNVSDQIHSTNDKNTPSLRMAD